MSHILHYPLIAIRPILPGLPTTCLLDTNILLRGHLGFPLRRPQSTQLARACRATLCHRRPIRLAWVATFRHPPMLALTRIAGLATLPQVLLIRACLATLRDLGLILLAHACPALRHPPLVLLVPTHLLLFHHPRRVPLARLCPTMSHHPPPISPIRLCLLRHP